MKSEEKKIREIIESLTSNEKELLLKIRKNEIILENKENTKILKSLEKKGLIREFNPSSSPDRDD